MKKLLIVAYYFPPSGGPGVQRVLKHIKYLPEFGWEPIVLTVSNGQYPARDESLLKQIPEGTRVIRTHIYEPYDLYRLLTGKKKGTAIDVNTIKKEDQKISFKEKLAEFIRATFFIPDARVGWLLSAKKAVRELEGEHIDAIYSSSPPYTCSLIAKYAKKRLRKPWVAGFRDPWTGFISSPERWALPKSIDMKMERTTFEQADAVEAAWEGIIKDALGKYPHLDKNKFHHVPNGYDSSDFPAVNYKPNARFTLTYTGSLYGRRNPAALFDAIESLISQGKLHPEDFLLRFVGRFGAEVEEMFNKASFRSSIETISYVPHDKSIEYLIQSELLLLIVDESKESAEIVPGKVYEYIGVMRPVLAIAPPQGAIAALIEETAAGKIAHQSNVPLIEEHFMDFFTNWKQNQAMYSPFIENIQKYERKNAAKKLAELLSELGDG